MSFFEELVKHFLNGAQNSLIGWGGGGGGLTLKDFTNKNSRLKETVRSLIYGQGVK